jgi:hypothetical protein
MLIGVAIPDNRNSEHLECESKSDTGNKRGDWYHFKMNSDAT